jgi:hypothetical protein
LTVLGDENFALAHEAPSCLPACLTSSMRDLSDFSSGGKTSEGQHPILFEKAVLSYVVEGDVEAAKLSEAIHLSQTKYCGVSAMLAKALPIEYRVLLNGTEIATTPSELTTHLKESV